MTLAIPGLSASVYQDDPLEASVVFSDQELVDSGDHLTYQVAWGFRYWDEGEVLIIECNDGGGFDPITAGFTVNYLRGSITFGAAQNPAYDFRVSGKRRSEVNFDKVMNIYDGQLKIDGKEIDTSSIDDDGWGSSINGSKKFTFNAKTFYYDGSIPISAIGVKQILKVYAFNRKGKHTSGNSPTIDISGGTDSKFKIQADQEVSATEVTLSLTTKNTGVKIATEMQSKIRAIGANYVDVEVKYEGVDLPGSHESGASPSTDISGGTDTKFKIQADSEGSPTTVTLTVAGKTNGTLIADEMTSKIQALGGAYAAVQVLYRDGIYLIVSGTAGPQSKIRITNGDTNNVADNLKIGTGNGGTNYDGSGGNYVIYSGTRGPNSKIRITDGDTLNIADNLKIGTLGTNLDGTMYSFIGVGSVMSLNNILASATDAQKQDITFNGQGEIYQES